MNQQQKIKDIPAASLLLAPEIENLVASEMAPGTGIEPARFWNELRQIVQDLGPVNRQLLQKRDEFQQAIDNWYLTVKRAGVDVTEPTVRKSFQRSIGYLLEEPDEFCISTANVDAEIAGIPGPQLVVPVDNARYALNAANARWGSLYDAFYGTDAIAEDDGAERGTQYNPVRGKKVVARTAAFLDESIPLVNASHADVERYLLSSQQYGFALLARLSDGKLTPLVRPEQFVGFQGFARAPSAILLRHHDLHIELCVDPGHPVGAAHPAGLCDVMLESAVTTIQDFEDSVAAVDAQDKARVYRHWLGLMQGSLTASFDKGGNQIERGLNRDRKYTGADGSEPVLPGRGLLMARNVGIHMYTDAVRTPEGDPIPEGFLDIMMTALAAKHDLMGNSEFRNSRTGSIYVVKPKLHGPEEVAATIELFRRVEQALDLPDKTIKIGIMDEERRTTINLKACIYEARERVVFINTGFLDRTGDEFHTMMEAGPVIPKAENKNSTWLRAYEDWNVDAGLATGFAGRAQIGKGMWAMPDAMAAMLTAKREHPAAGASTAWVPSPTAATLHALHYHDVDVHAVQAQLEGSSRGRLTDILAFPIMRDGQPDEEDIRRELDNNAQSILGYVVRWIQQGAGCSKVADIDGNMLMEDRATLRISSQQLANWLHHELISADDVRSALCRMAAVVDRQNSTDPAYRPMGQNPEQSIAFQAALALVLEGRVQPNGYTEKLLHKWRRKYKAMMS